MPAAYTFTDRNISLTGNYTYKLKQVDYDGSFRYSKEEKINYSAAEVFELSQNYPNPFNPTTIITYSFPSQGFVSLKVYNILGKDITALVNEIKQAGQYEIVFDCNTLKSDIYFYKISARYFKKTRKMILLK